jgi:hypothetical protein
MGSQAECRRFDSLRPLHNLRLPGPGSPCPLAYRGGLMRHYSTWHRSKRSVAARRLGDSGSREAVLLPCAARADARSSFRGRPLQLALLLLAISVLVCFRFAFYFVLARSNLALVRLCLAAIGVLCCDRSLSLYHICRSASLPSPSAVSFCAQALSDHRA